MDEGLQPLTYVLMRKSICILAFSPIAQDARVLRQIKYLSPFYDLTVIGYGSAPSAYQKPPHIKWIQLSQQAQPEIPNLVTALKNHDLTNIHFRKRIRRKARNFFNKVLLLAGYIFSPAYELWYRRQADYREALQYTVNLQCHAYHANDWNTLPILAEAAQRNKAALVLDLHEYAPLEYENRPQWWIKKNLIAYILNKYSSQVNAMTTVAVPIANKYRDEFGFDPIVIMNAPEKLSSLPHMMVNPTINLIHHGVASNIRHPELMIKTIARCDERYNLHLMFIYNDYVETLRRMAETIAPGRVFFHDPVPPEDITKYIARFDVGFFVLPPINFNYKFALPNKFFEFICAGLAVCIGPSPAMAEIVKSYGIGVVCDTFDPEAMASMINRISTKQWVGMRQAATKASYELNAHVEMKKLVNIYGDLLSRIA
jgi:glycosyltransferase involved in cell wall biosynthesis